MYRYKGIFTEDLKQITNKKIIHQISNVIDKLNIGDIISVGNGILLKYINKNIFQHLERNKKNLELCKC